MSSSGQLLVGMQMVTGSCTQTGGFSLISNTVEDFSYTYSEEERVKYTEQILATGRKTNKLSKEKPEAVWPLQLEAAFLQGLEAYSPHKVGAKPQAITRFPLRNKFISDYIFEFTNKRRSPKQVGSRLQQLRDTCKNPKILHLIHRGNNGLGRLQCDHTIPISSSSDPVSSTPALANGPMSIFQSNYSQSDHTPAGSLSPALSILPSTANTTTSKFDLDTPFPLATAEVPILLSEPLSRAHQSGYTQTPSPPIAPSPTVLTLEPTVTGSQIEYTGTYPPSPVHTARGSILPPEPIFRSPHRYCTPHLHRSQPLHIVRNPIPYFEPVSTLLEATTYISPSSSPHTTHSPVLAPDPTTTSSYQSYVTPSPMSTTHSLIPLHGPSLLDTHPNMAHYVSIPPSVTPSPVTSITKRFTHVKISIQSELQPSLAPSIDLHENPSALVQTVHLAPLASLISQPACLPQNTPSAAVLPLLFNCVYLHSPFPLSLHSKFSVYVTGFHRPVHVEVAPLSWSPLLMQSTGWSYSSELIPGFWNNLGSSYSHDLSQYTIIQSLMSSNTADADFGGSTIMLFVIYRFTATSNLTYEMKRRPPSDTDCLTNEAFNQGTPTTPVQSSNDSYSLYFHSQPYDCGIHLHDTHTTPATPTSSL